MLPTITQTEGGTLQNDLFANLQQLVALLNPIKLTGAADALNPLTSATYIPSRAGVDAMTLGAPIDVVDDGTVLVVISGSAFAHTITSAGLFNTGAAGTNVLTFAAFKGASVILYALGGKWNVLALNGVTVTS